MALTHRDSANGFVSIFDHLCCFDDAVAGETAAQLARAGSASTEFVVNKNNALAGLRQLSHIDEFLDLKKRNMNYFEISKADN